MAKPKPSETKVEVSPAKHWQDEIIRAGKYFETWQARGKKVVQRYRDERVNDEQAHGLVTNRKFNILWSNVQTLFPAMYSRPPKVQVSRRFNDADPIARCASTIIERAVDVELEQYDIGSVMRPCVEDRLLPGRATAWVRYEPHLVNARSSVALKASKQEDGVQISQTYSLPDGTPYTGKTEERDGVVYGEGPDQQEIEYECTPTDYVHWKDFLCSPARIWEEVWWVGRKVYMNKESGTKRFGAKFEQVPLDARMPGDDQNQQKSTPFDCAVIWEIWDKTKKCVYWVHESFPEILDEKPDPLKLRTFFPTPKPLTATLTTGSLIPVPDYCQYQDQAQELDDLTERIALLTKALKVVGIYDASQTALQRLLSEGVDNQMVPCNTWAMFAEKGGLKGVVDFLPIQQVAEVIVQLYQNRAQVKNDLYEITGIGDVIRGSSDPNETATAQGIKAKYAGLRLSEHQADVERFARDLIRLKAEIMAEKYRPETLIQMSGIMHTPEFLMPEELKQAPPPPQMQPGRPPDPKVMQEYQQAVAQHQQAVAAWNQKTQDTIQQAIALLKSPAFRDFRIDIETRSMAQMDEEGEQQRAMGFLTAAGDYMQKAQQMVQANPATTELAGQLLLFMVRRFPIGRELESTFDRMLDQAKKQPPGIPPEMQKQIEATEQDLQKRSEKVAADEQAIQGEQIKTAEERISVESDKKVAAAEDRARKAEIRLAEVQAEAALARKAHDLTCKVKEMVDGGKAAEAEEFAKRAADPDYVAPPPEPTVAETVTEVVAQSQAQVLEAIAQLIAALQTPKTVRMVAPSGKVYEGEVSPTIQ